MRRPLILIPLLVLAGCGSSDDSKGPSKATAIREIGNVRTALAQARTTFRAGDFKTAATQVGDAYLDHFENVEEPLSKVDNTLMLKTEKEIRETLKGLVGAGSPENVVAPVFQQISTDLDAAEAKLK